MDSLTHIALGACLGDAFAGKQLGKRAMFIGAVAQSLPDIDFVASFFTSDADGLLAHRGFTHSILFALASAIILGLLAEKWHRPHNISARKWIFFFGIQIFIHLLLDGMNVYGVGWVEPFSHYRVSYNWIFVADPFYSIWLAIAFVALLVLRKNHPKREWWVRFGVGMSCVYLLYCGLNKMKIDREVRQIFKSQHLSYSGYFSTPTAFNTWLWYVVASTDSGFYIGYHSVFDREKKMDLRFFRQNMNMLKPVLGHEDLQKLIRFSKGYYIVQRWSDTLVFNDLRFGQMIGWEDPGAPFVFYYYLEHPHGNHLVVQRGRFKGFNNHSIHSLLQRIKGK
jgi:inner membrane protein